MGAFSQGPMNVGGLASTPPGTPHTVLEFFTAPLCPPKYTISGITKDLNGVALAGCTVEIYETVTALNPNEPKGRLVGMTVSDANGVYSVDVYAGPGATFKAVSYKAGSPDVCGTTLNTLTGG